MVARLINPLCQLKHQKLFCNCIGVWGETPNIKLAVAFEILYSKFLRPKAFFQKRIWKSFARQIPQQKATKEGVGVGKKTTSGSFFSLPQVCEYEFYFIGQAEIFARIPRKISCTQALTRAISFFTLLLIYPPLRGLGGVQKRKESCTRDFLRRGLFVKKNLFR